MSSSKLVVKDHGYNGVMSRLLEVRRMRVKVGVLASGEKGEHGKLTVAEYAAVNEFGTADGRIPARSFLRSTFDEQRTALATMGRKLMMEVVLGKMSTEQALGMLGAKLAAEVKKKITTGTGVPPPNAPSTIRRKMKKGAAAKYFNRPLDMAHVNRLRSASQRFAAGSRERSRVEGLAQRAHGDLLGRAFAQIGAAAAVRTLVDTGRMVNAITWQVSKSGK